MSFQRNLRAYGLRTRSTASPLSMDDSRFNGSRSEGLALQKFVREREIGIDVEKIRPQSYLRKMA